MRLIDAEALKAALKSNCKPELCHDYNTAWCERCCRINDFEDLIDNAPTVEYPFYAEAYQTGYEEAKMKGEWIEKVETKQLGYGWLTTRETVCSICGGSGEDDESIPQCWKFCPHCGAYMKGEEE